MQKVRETVRLVFFFGRIDQRRCLGWDACAAAAFGFHAIWVNRDGAPMDRLFGRPAHVLGDLGALPALLARD